MAGLSIHDASVSARLHAVSLHAQPGQLLGLIGPNGSGKSSLLQALAGLLPTSGQVRLCEQPLAHWNDRERAQRLGFLPQRSASAWALRVRDVVGLGRLPWQDGDAPAGQAAIAAAMQQTGVQAWAERSIAALSGGEQARVYLARVLAGQPQVLLADEPMASFDLLYQQQIAHTLQSYAQQGHAVVLALHDLSLAARYCDQLALMHRGLLVALGTPAQVLQPERLTQVYGLAVKVDLAAEPPVVVAR